MSIDYTKFTPEGPSQKAAQDFDKRWWRSPKTRLAGSVTSVVNQLADFDSARQMQYQVSSRLYGNVSLLGTNGLSMAKMQAQTNSRKDRVTYNIVQSAIDTVTAKMAKNRPKPLFLTSGGDYKIQKRAKQLDKFVDGILYENNAWGLGTDCMRDAGVLGDGVVQVFELHGRVKLERVLASELYVDPLEAFYGDPRQLHRVKNVDRDVLIDLFPECRNAILRADPAKSDAAGSQGDVANQVTVVESWHLPSGPEAKDGLHCICLEEEPLFVEDWNKPVFPFAKLPWTKRMGGYWSQGAAEQLQGTQLEINKLLWVIQRSMHLAGSFKIWFKTGTKVVKEQFNNEIGAIINGEEMPQYLVPPIVQPEIYAHLNTLITRGFEQVGVSMLSAASQKPAGLDSGKALREYNDIESDRFQVLGQRYEQFFLDLAKLIISCATDIYAREGKFEVKVPGKKFVETIDWKDIDLDEDEFVMKVFPVSSLPNEPAGRLATVQEYVQAGFITPKVAQKLLNFPDLEAQETRDLAPQEWIDEVIEKIIEDGEYEQLDGTEDLVYAKTEVINAISMAKQQKVEEEKIDLLRQMSERIDFLTNQAQQALQPQPGGPEPQAAPLPQPTSDMIQNVPGAA